MKAYLLDNKSHPLDGSLEKELKKLNTRMEHIKLPGDHEEILSLFEDKEGGLVFLPEIWEDLFCVKILHELQLLKNHFETIIVGPTPSVPDLIVAFNDGLTCYLQTPVDEGKLKQVTSRGTDRLNKKLEHENMVRRLADYESGSTPHHYTPQIQERDQLLGHGIVDIINQQGPLAKGDVRVLLVSTSKAQQKKLNDFLKGLGMDVVNAGTIKDAVKSAQDGKYSIVISDNILPDGDAVDLVNRLRKSLKTELPRFFVWSASPDKIADLLNPENHIDDVIIKPGPGVGIESILPTILAGVYGTQS